MKLIPRLVFVFVYIWFTLQPGMAQTTSSAIAGRVVDASGAALARVPVSLTNQLTGEVRLATTESSGDFVFAAVQPGTFTVTVNAPGFKVFQKHDLNLSSSERLAAGTLKLEVGAVSETVTVESEHTTIQTESTERSALLDAKEISNLMTQGRDVMALMQLLPGVVKDGGSNQLGSTDAGTVNGIRSDNNSINVDGVTGNARGGAKLDTPLNMDAVGEVKVLLNNYQAEYGQTSGAIVQLVTKGGSRNFHGSVYYYNRNEAYNANDYFNKNKAPVVARGITRYNTIGYNVGGPIYIPNHFNANKNKLFFFYSQEIWPTKKSGGVQRFMMPTELERKGDFSQSVDKNGKPVTFLKDPQKIALGLACAKAGDPGCFSSLVIPASRLDANTQALMSLFPLPNVTNNNVSASSGLYNFVNQVPVSSPTNQRLLRIDYNISSKLHSYFRGTITSAHSSGSAVAANPAGMQWGVPFTYNTPGTNYSFNLTYIPNPTLVNELTGGWANWQETSGFATRQTSPGSRERPSVLILVSTTPRSIHSTWFPGSPSAEARAFPSPTLPRSTSTTASRSTTTAAPGRSPMV